MIKSDGYIIEQYPKQNKIVITLPPTIKTLTNTFYEVVERKDKLSGDELLSILTVVEKFYEKE